MYKHFLLKSIKWSYIVDFLEFQKEKGENVFNSLIKYLEYFMLFLLLCVFDSVTVWLLFGIF